MKKIIVSQRLSFNYKTKEKRDSVDIKLINLLLKANFFPVPIPNLFSSLENKSLAEFIEKINAKGLILTGGENLGKYKIRDELEIKLLKYFTKQKKPILGICRGAQMIAKFFGSKIKKVNNHVRVKHKTIIVSKDNLFPKKVNSYHDYGIDKCPSNFITTVLAKDNSIEAFKHKKFRWEGWMWHPERDKTFSKSSLNRIKYIFD